MCRVFGYIGRPISLEDLLYSTDHSLLAQVYDVHQHYLLNLAGFGFAAWEHDKGDYEVPFVYRNSELPMYDNNIKPMAAKISPSALIAHVRGVRYDQRQVVADQNVHPFQFTGTPLILAMNGALDRFGEMRYDLLPYIRPEFAKQIEGTTDTEWVYAVLCSHLENPAGPLTADDMAQAVIKTLRIFRDVRVSRGIDTESGMNLVLSDGHSLVTTRYVYDFGWFADANAYWTRHRTYGYLSLWYTVGGGYAQQNGEWIMTDEGKADSIIIASEPLTNNTATWVEVPEYSMMVVQPQSDDDLSVSVREIML